MDFDVKQLNHKPGRSLDLKEHKLNLLVEILWHEYGSIKGIKIVSAYILYRIILQRHHQHFWAGIGALYPSVINCFRLRSVLCVVKR